MAASSSAMWNSGLTTAAAAPSSPLPTAARVPPPGPGWRDLFDGRSLSGWRGDTSLLAVENGVLVNENRRGVVMVPGQFDDFEAMVDFRLSSGGNSGLGIRYGGTGDPAFTGLEIQMLDDESYKAITPDHRCGSIFRLAAARTGPHRRWPEWNTLHVTAIRDGLTVGMNGTVVVQTTRTGGSRANQRHAGLAAVFGGDLSVSDRRTERVPELPRAGADSQAAAAAGSLPRLAVGTMPLSLTGRRRTSWSPPATTTRRR